MDIDTPAFDRLRRQAIDLRRAGRSRREIKQLLQVSGEGLLTELLRGEPAPEWTKRPRAKDGLRAEARALRARGMSYNEIAAELGISKSSCSLWLRDMPRPIDRREQVRRSVAARQPGYQARRARTAVHRWEVKARAASQIGTLTTRDLILAGALVYWCEGAKNKPDRRVDRVDFINGDPAMIALFLRFLDTVGVDRARLRFQIQIHASADLEAAERFWRALTGADPDQFNQVVIKQVNPRTNRRNVGADYHGCLRLGVLRSAELYHQIVGWAQGAMAAVNGEAVTGSPCAGSAPRSRRQAAYEAIAESAVRQVGGLERRELLILGALAYWCEGGKDKPYQRREMVAFINGDPAMIAFFAGFLEMLGVGRERWKPRVHIHERGDVEAAVLYWAGVVGMAPERFRESAIKRHPPGSVRRHKEHYVGCLRIDVAQSADLYRQIEGWALASMLGEVEARAGWAESAGRNGGDLRLPNGAAASEPVS